MVVLKKFILLFVVYFCISIFLASRVQVLLEEIEIPSFWKWLIESVVVALPLVLLSKKKSQNKVM